MRGGRGTSEPLRIDILVVPRASRTAVGPLVGGRLRVAVTAPPVDGEANAAVIEAVAKAYGVRRSDVTIAHGERGRRKTLVIENADPSARAGAIRTPPPPKPSR